jgi:hypothetical protein
MVDLDPEDQRNISTLRQVEQCLGSVAGSTHAAARGRDRRRSYPTWEKDTTYWCCGTSNVRTKGRNQNDCRRATW